jgi:transposase
MTEKRKRYTAEFKAEATRLAQRRDRSIAEVARELGVHPEVLRRARVASEPVREAPASLEEENRRLRRENARLQEERDILKKAAVNFASESQ